MGQAIAITGLGCLTAAGPGVGVLRRCLDRGERHLAISPQERLPLSATLPCAAVTTPLPPLPSRTAGLALVAAREALRESGIDPAACAVITGSCTAGLPESEVAFAADRAAAAPAYRRQQSHRLTHMVARILGCEGPRSSHSVACASSACALAEAAEWVRQGLAPAVLVVGADALTRVTLDGFHALRLVDPAGSRPLTQERAGLTLGEGAAAIVLEDPEHARRRGATVLASLLGWGLRADAYHATAPDPTGAHLGACIEDCLTDAGVASAAIGYVSAHGTGTQDNDGNEAATLARRLGAVPTASLKGSLGHTLGAAALIEALACVEAIRAQRQWGSVGASNGTPITGIDVVTTTRDARVDAVLSTTLAFGGANAALCFGQPQRVA